MSAGGVAAAALRHRGQPRAPRSGRSADATARCDPRPESRPLTDRLRPGGACARCSASVASTSSCGRARRRDGARDPRGDRDDGARPGPGGAVDAHLRRRLRPGHRPGRGGEDYCARSPRPAATSPSASPTCATSATGPSRVLLGLDEPGLPPGHGAVRPRGPRPGARRDRGLDPGRVLAIITEAGGALSHTAVLAAQLGIPAVVQLAAALTWPTARWSPSTEAPDWWWSTPTRPTAPS